MRPAGSHIQDVLDRDVLMQVTAGHAMGSCLTLIRYRTSPGRPDRE